MPTRPLIFVWILLLLAGLGTPAAAGQPLPSWQSWQPWQFLHRRESCRWHRIHHAIHRLEDTIAFLEADPDIDEGDKAPVIGRARAGVRRGRAALGPARWPWTAPCCYSRRPITIR